MKQILLLFALLSLSLADFPTDCLNAHNPPRQAFGSPDLTWSPDLANSAQAYANQMASTGIYEHSGTPGVGENLNMGTSGAFTTAQWIQGWVDEGQNFVPGIFPDVSMTGNWMDIGHYTQVIWPTTTQVGCGIATGAGGDYFVCQYTPPGNVEGQALGVTARRPSPVSRVRVCKKRRNSLRWASS